MLENIKIVAGCLCHNIPFDVPGSVEVGLVIDSYCDVPCKIMHVASGMQHLHLNTHVLSPALPR